MLWSSGQKYSSSHALWPSTGNPPDAIDGTMGQKPALTSVPFARHVPISVLLAAKFDRHLSTWISTVVHGLRLKYGNSSIILSTYSLLSRAAINEMKMKT